MDDRSSILPPASLLEQLPEELDRLGRELRQAASEADLLKDRLATGMSWQAALRTEPEPEVTRRLSEVTSQLTILTARLRRAKVLALKREGMTQDAIARLFGVSRQRICAMVEQHRREQQRQESVHDRPW